MHDTGTDRWTLFDDEKVRHIPGVNCHGPGSGSSNGGGGGAGGTKRGKGRASKASSGCGMKKKATGSNDEAAAAESEAETEFLREVLLYSYNSILNGWGDEIHLVLHSSSSKEVEYYASCVGSRCGRVQGPQGVCLFFGMIDR